MLNSPGMNAVPTVCPWQPRQAFGSLWSNARFLYFLYIRGHTYLLAPRMPLCVTCLRVIIYCFLFSEALFQGSMPCSGARGPEKPKSRMGELSRHPICCACIHASIK